MVEVMEYRCGEGARDPIVCVSDVIDLAREAGAVIMEIYRDLENWDVRIKSDESPVTKADFLANDLICTHLTRSFPDIPIISEESESLPFEERRNFRHYWVVDPLDGTKEFVKRTGDFAVMIGLCRGNAPVMGVVHAPAREEPATYYALEGRGAYVAPGGQGITGINHSKRLRVRAFNPTSRGLVLAVSASRPPLKFIEACQDAATIAMGSAALKAIAVAEGKADIFPCVYNVRCGMYPVATGLYSEWDTCATHIIVEEAGGSVVQHEGGEALALVKDGFIGQPLVYNKEDLSSPKCIFLGRTCAGGAAQEQCA